MIRQVAHTCFYTDQLDTMKEFYAEKLGLRYAFPMKNPEDKIFGIYLDAGNSTFIEIFDREGAQKMWGGEDTSITRGTSYRHLCFEVTGLNDYRAELVKKGIPVTEPTVGLDGSRQAWITDPDGNPIELMEYTHKSEQLAR
ncbi:MAG TPA: VOC family protein [Spirochaetia bacterium]|nr:VOC family protein [Spirochaetia bacterium]